MRKLIGWFSQHILELGTLALLIFIPLYPKLPLIDIVRTWVYIRVDDFAVAIVVGLFFLTLVRNRAFPNSPMTAPITVYWGIGLISAVYSVLFLGSHIPNYFGHLVFLHYLRRIEYMILFFVAFSAFSGSSAKLKWLVTAIAVTIIGVFLYGIGQKFYGFPAFLTMNEEFAKGIPLRLPPTARLASTFGGHYDLAAFLVLMIPILGSFALSLSKLWQKLFFFLLSVASLFLLLLTASRVSFGMYLIAISVMLYWHRKWWLIPPVVVLSIVMLTFVSGASERFYKTLRFSDVVVDLSTGRAIGTIDKIQGTGVTIEKIASPAEETLPKGSGFINVPQGSSGAGQGIETVEIVKSMELATGSGEVATISGSFLIQKALVYDISITTRFQGQWPKAIEAFKRNILLGSGFSTLSVAADGDYHRMLGETGILGTVAFLGIFLVGFTMFFRAKQKLTGTEKGLVIGMFAGSVGLLLNAILIDVFEASKVAYTFWLLYGVAFAVMTRRIRFARPYGRVLWEFFTQRRAFVVYIVAIIVFVYRQAFTIYFVGDDFTWLRWAAQSSASDIGRYFTEAQGFFYRPLPKVVYFLLFSVFWLKATMYHLVNILAVSATAIAVYFLMVRRNVPWSFAFLLAVLFGVMSVHHESVFWVSGLSSLLAGFFVFWSLLFSDVASVSKRWQWVWWVLTFVCMAAAQLSYDGMGVAPVLLFLFLWGIHGRRLPALSALLFVPFYFWVRASSGALGAQGDYSVKLPKLPVNAAVNAAVYMVSSVVGPRVVEHAESLRLLLKSFIAPITGMVGGICIVISLVLWRIRSRFAEAKGLLVCALCFAASLAAYLGLGNAAERYGFVASGFFILFISEVFLFTHSERWQTVKKLTVGAMVLIAIVWNVAESNRLGGEWKAASDITEQTLLTIKKEFFPLKEEVTFVFVNVPIRFGRAWIFPTGLDDAIWHMFRTAPHHVIIASSLDEAFAYSVPKGRKEILLFEEGKLKRVVKEVKVVNK